MHRTSWFRFSDFNATASDTHPNVYPEMVENGEHRTNVAFRCRAVDCAWTFDASILPGEDPSALRSLACADHDANA